MKNFCSKQNRYFYVYYLLSQICFEIKVKLPSVRNNLVEQINHQFDYILFENTCFQRVLIGSREKRTKYLFQYQMNTEGMR